MFKKVKKQISSHKKSFLCVIFFTFIIYSVITLANNTPETSQQSFQLVNNNYENLELGSGHYDGVDTFFQQSEPELWKQDEPSSTLIDIVDYSSYSDVLRVYDNNVGANPYAKYYFEWFNNSNYNGFNGTFIDFWISTSSNSQDSYFLFKDNDSNNLFFFRFDGSDNDLDFYDYDSTSYTKLDNYVSGSWKHISMYLGPVIEISGGFVRNTKVIIYVNNVLTINTNIDEYYTNFSYCQAYTSGSGGYGILVDALGYMKVKDNNQITGGGSSVSFDYEFKKFKTQIKNLDYIPSRFNMFCSHSFYNYLSDEKNPYGITNYDELDSNLNFDVYDSIISEIPNSANNFRYWFNTEYVNIENSINKLRMVRLQDQDNSQRKYKLFQIYVDDLNETNFDSNDDGTLENQTIESMIYSYDDSDNLINKYKLTIDFTNETGRIYWNAYYKHPDYPIWSEQPTNPIFDFSDYLEANEKIDNLQLNLHFKLTKFANQCWIHIKTDVCFNQKLESIYSYDKLISGGNSSFYDQQSRLYTKYIDYFTLNFSDYYESEHPEFSKYFRYNNLRGLRLLMTNSTDFFENFLEIDWFLDPANIDELPDNKDNPDIDDEPTEPTQDYWTYTIFKIKTDYVQEIEFSDTIEFNETHTETIQHSYEFTHIEGQSVEAKFYYDDNAIKRSQLGSWKFDFEIISDFEVSISFNFIRNGIVLILNSIILFGYWMLFLFWISFSFVFTYILYVQIVPFFNNTIIFGILYASNYAIFRLIFLWFFLMLVWQTLYEVIIKPFLEWLYQDGLMLFAEIVILVWSYIIATIIWLITFGQSDFETIRQSVYDFSWIIANFMLETIVIVVENLAEMLLYVYFYLMFILFCLAKHIYTKVKGITNRSHQLQESYEAYMFPLHKGYELLKRLKEIIKWW